MTNKELEILKHLYQEELKKRKEIMKLMEENSVVDFLTLTGEVSKINDYKHKYSLEPDDIFRDVLTNFSLSGTSEIYFVNYKAEDSFGRKTYYANLENYGTGYDKKVYEEDVEDFERKHDVLDNNNVLFQEEGCGVAQANFFLEAFRVGPESAKKMILEKYGSTRKNQ